MTRTHEDHARILEPYHDPVTDMIDLARFARDTGIDTLVAAFGPSTGNPDEDTYVIGQLHNTTVATHRNPPAMEIRGAWLQVFARPTFWIVFCAAQMLVALLAR